MDTAPITMYLHTNYDGVQRRIMSSGPPYGIQQSTFLSQEILFTSQPAIGVTSRISGAIVFNLWLIAQSTGVAIVNSTLSQRYSDNNMSIVCSVESPVVISSQLRPQPYSFAVGPIFHVMREGSVLEFRINVRQTQTAVALLWDASQTASNVVVPFSKESYHPVLIQARDSVGRALYNATITVRREGNMIWVDRTNQKGEATLLIFYGEPPGGYEITVSWRGTDVNKTRGVEFAEGTTVLLLCRVHNLRIIAYDALGTALPDASVELMTGEQSVAVNSTRSNGEALFSQLPEGTYTANILYHGDRLATFGVTLLTSQRLEISTRILQAWFRYLISTIFLSVVGTGLVFSRRTLRAHRTPFAYLINELGGNMPESSVVMIEGSPGSGKTVLMQKLVEVGIREERNCLFISNQEFPEKILEDMTALGLAVGQSKRSRLMFIDWYSGIAGREPVEKLSVAALSDLTTLGTQLSAGITALGQGTLVFLDSIDPLLSVITVEKTLNFIHAIGARVKGQGGSLFFTTGISVDENFLSRIESISDCIIELEGAEQRTELRRSLRIRKLRGRSHSQKWIQFSIEREEGIVFYTSKRLR